MCSHSVPHHHLHRAWTWRKHHQQGLCDHYWGQSHPDGEAVAGSPGWEAGLWSWLSGELWVPWFRCGGDQKGRGERVSVRIGSCHVSTHKHAEADTHIAWSDCLPLCWQLGHDGATPESCWLVDELSVAVPTKGVKYVFACKCWLAKDRGDGLTSRLFNVLDAESISISKKVCKREQNVEKHSPTAENLIPQSQLSNLHPIT